MKKQILIILSTSISTSFIHTLTIINKSELPAVITQVTLQRYDGLEKTAIIKQTHISIAPEETIDLAQQGQALSRIMGLTLAFNNTEFYFTTMPPHTEGSIIIEKGATVQLSPEIKRVSQELLIPEKNLPESRFGPHLI